MTRTTLLITLAAAAALAGCNKENHTIVAGGPADDTNAAAEAPVALPPAIASSKVYRCKDNKVIYVNWMSDGTARVKKTRDEIGGTPVTPGDQLKGDANAASITYNGESCKS
jgi:curli biogenesis system outer membrane secretion channel CsgG